MGSPEIVTSAAVNLNAATQTKTYVQGKMDIGASNKFGDNLSGLTLPVWCVSQVRDDIMADLRGQAAEIKRTGADPLKAIVDTWASHARQMGCGNCGEQSALAFVTLRDFWKVSPLDWMQVGNWKHGFVVIGRVSATNASDVGTWNSEAVVCDPWRGFARPAPDARYLVGEPIKVIYRLDAT